jgi:hypothetical protein
MDTMMIAWVLGVPAALMLVVLGLERLESLVVAPIDRAVKISKLVEDADADAVEHRVSIMLAPVIGAEPRS